MRLLRRAPAESVRPVRPSRPVRATRTTSPTRMGQGFTDGVRQFVYDTKVELRKVVWPTREQAVNLTVLVIAVSAAVAAFIGAIDYLIQNFFVMLLKLLGGA